MPKAPTKGSSGGGDVIGKLKARRAMKKPAATECVIGHVGPTLVLSAERDVSPSATVLARSLPAERDRTVVVLDFPAGMDIRVWGTVAAALRGRGAIRLATSHAGSLRPTAPAQWLAEQLQTEVIAPDGVLMTVPGSAFVASPQGYGCWLRFGPGRSPVPFGKRFPIPDWETMDPHSPWQTGMVGVAEPIPAGMWLRSRQTAPLDRTAWYARPILALPCREDVLTVVLGGPGQPPIPADEICLLLSALPFAARSRVRLAPYAMPGGLGHTGQLVADRLDEHITTYTGLPIAADRNGAGISVVAVDRHGQPTWWPFVTELTYAPRKVRNRGGPAVPAVVGSRPPVAGLTELQPGVFRLAEGVVVEVVASGLWVREATEPCDAALVRALPLDPEWARLTIGTPGKATRGVVAVAGASLVERLEPEIRKVLRLVYCDDSMHATAGGSSGRQPPGTDRDGRIDTSVIPTIDPMDDANTVNDNIREEKQPENPVRSLPSLPLPSTAVSGTRSTGRHAQRAVVSSLEPSAPLTVASRLDGPVRMVKSLSDSSTSVWVPPSQRDAVRAASDAVLIEPAPGDRETIHPDHQSTQQEREWMRQTLGARYNTHASAVCRLLAQRRSLFTLVDEEPLEAIVTDLVSVRAHMLSGDRTMNQALRTGVLGPLRHYAGCVVSGLRRLPNYSGVTVCWATVDPAERGQRYRPGAELVEHGLLNTLANPAAAPDCNMEFLVWSVTGRRIRVLDPLEDTVLDRVVFQPGTVFTVLGVIEPEGPAPTQVMLEEVVGPQREQQTSPQRIDVIAALRTAAATQRSTPSRNQRDTISDPDRSAPAIDTYADDPDSRADEVGSLLSLDAGDAVEVGDSPT